MDSAIAHHPVTNTLPIPKPSRAPFLATAQLLGMASYGTDYRLASVWFCDRSEGEVGRGTHHFLSCI